MAFEVAMLEVNPGGAIPLRSEPHFNLTRFREIGLVLPRGSDLPCHDEALRRLPDEDPSPVAFGPIGLLGVAAAIGMSLDNKLFRRSGADVVTAWPPAVHSFGEDPECTLSLPETRFSLNQLHLTQQINKLLGNDPGPSFLA